MCRVFAPCCCFMPSALCYENMDIITSHTNADFDALASMLAAKKLYPEARLVFPGSQEKSMRDFFLESAFYALDIEKLKNIDPALVTRLIIVDNRNIARLGRLADLLSKPGISIHVYDHHPSTEGDIHGEVEVIQPVGATTTIMIELLRERNISISPIEATILALGIYEETGSLTFISTTERDAAAVAWLIGQGANLNIVSDFMSRDLSQEQFALMNELMSAASSYDIGGVRVIISAIATAHFVADIANIAHKIREVEGLDVLFLIVQMGEKTYIVGRSRIPQVNAGLVLEELGGGGHAAAAAGVLKDVTYLQAKEMLLDALKRHIKPGPLVSDIMTSTVKTISAGSTISEAGEAMTRFSVNVLPVMSGTRFEGLITREVVQKALFHGLGGHKVEEFMSTGVRTASPDMPMAHVERVMIEERQRFIPVLDKNGAIVGAVTRTDLLRALHEERLMGGEPTGGLSMKNIKGMLEERLPREVRDALKAVGDVADETGFQVYLVGGVVRDLFLRVQNLDIDIVVEGDGITFAGLVVKKLGGRMKSHLKFGTAVVVLPSGIKLDIATARLEYYESPAALPTVELSSIKKDLYRRDFTINTLAVRLNRTRFGELIDFFGGVRDIKERTIRILHNLSFVEDPTRVFRAIRFEQRFDFRISKHTMNLIRTAVKLELFHKLAGERIYGELVLMFGETDPLKVIRRMSELELLQFIHPALKYTDEIERLFKSVNETLTWYRLLYLDLAFERWLVYFLALLDKLKDQAVDEALERLSVPERIRDRIRRSRRCSREILYEFYRAPKLRASRIYDILRPIDIETLLFMMAKAKREGTKKYISQYLTRLMAVRVDLTGEDLKALGLPPGPRYREILLQLLHARLDGIVKDRDDEIDFVKKLATA